MKGNTLKDKILYIYSIAGILIILILMMIILTFMTDAFFTYRNIINIIRQITFYAIIGLGEMLVIIGGDFDLSPGSVVGLTSVLTAMSIQTTTNNSIVIPFLIMLAIGGSVGLVNGVLVAYARMPAFIATLGTQTLVRGLALLISNGNPVSNLKSSFTFLGGGVIGNIPVPVIILAIVAAITWYIMKYTRLGRHVYAIGGNMEAAIVSGINAKMIKVFTFAFCGVLAALAGVILTARVQSGQPSLGSGFELQAIAGCVIGGVSLAGGVGTVAGVFFGIMLIGVLNNGMDLMNVSGYMQQIVQGLIIIGAVMIDMKRNKA